MYGIYIAAIITTVLSLLVYGSFVFIKAKKKALHWYIAAILVHIPIYWAAFYFFRVPLDWLITRVMDTSSGWYLFTAMAYAPITEEPAKWILLPVVAIVLIITKAEKLPFHPIKMALAIGLGFGIGEMWLLAAGVAKVPDYAGIPWYMFSGFISERFMVCFLHAAFVAVVWSKLRKGRAIIWGMLIAMLLHYFANFPIYLKIIDLGNFGEMNWMMIISVYIYLFFFAMIILVLYLTFSSASVGGVLYGKARCPSCGEVYPRPYFAIKLKGKRRERCPHCREVHSIGEADVVPRDGPGEIG